MTVFSCQMMGIPRGLSTEWMVADSLFIFVAQRFVASFDILGCGTLLNLPDPV